MLNLSKGSIQKNLINPLSSRRIKDHDVVSRIGVTLREGWQFCGLYYYSRLTNLEDSLRDGKMCGRCR